MVNIHEHWEKQHRNSEQALYIAQKMLERMVNPGQLKLFEEECQVIPFPVKQESAA